MTRVSRPHTSKRGFTLFELVMVITIMGIMTGMALPSFRNVMQGRALQDTAQSIANILRYARSESIQRSAVSIVRFDAESGLIEFAIESNPLQQPGSFEARPMPFPPPKSLQEPATVKIAGIEKAELFAASPENEIRFTPSGSTSDTLITLVDPNQRVYTVGIVGLTGQVLIWDRPVESLYEE